MLGLELLPLQLHLDQDQGFFLKVFSSCLLAAGGSLYQSLQGQQQNGFLHVAFGPLFHVGSPFDHCFQRKLLSELMLKPWCLMKVKLDFVNLELET